MKKQQLLYALLPALALLSGGAALAATNSGPPTHFSDVVTAIAQKFNLSTTDVQKVVDEVMQKQHADRAAAMQTQMQDRLKQAVTEGKITQAQADLITAKQAEMKTFMDSLQGKTAADKETALKNQMSALKQWAADNNIPALYLTPMGGARGMRGALPHERGSFHATTKHSASP